MAATDACNSESQINRIYISAPTPAHPSTQTRYLQTASCVGSHNLLSLQRRHIIIKECQTMEDLPQPETTWQCGDLQSARRGRKWGWGPHPPNWRKSGSGNDPTTCPAPDTHWSRNQAVTIAALQTQHFPVSEKERERKELTTSSSTVTTSTTVNRITITVSVHWLIA